MLGLFLEELLHLPKKDPKKQQGPIILNPTRKKLLTDIINLVYSELQPQQLDRGARQSLIRSIEEVIREKVPGSSISPFGSYTMDLFTSSSDLDLSLSLADGMSRRSHESKVYHLRRVEVAMRGLRNDPRLRLETVEAVYATKVPVVKFKELTTGIESDISIDNNIAILKSEILGVILTMDSRFRELCYLIKKWAKEQMINSSFEGTLNSLSICLLVAFHLQTRSPPILPAFSEFMEGLDMSNVPKSVEIVASRVKKFKDTGSGSDNSESVPELFTSFFVELLGFENRWKQEGLSSSTYDGKWVHPKRPNFAGRIHVEDFLEREENVARSVSSDGFLFIYGALVSTVGILRDFAKGVEGAAEALEVFCFGSNHHFKDNGNRTGGNNGNRAGGNRKKSSRRKQRNRV